MLCNDNRSYRQKTYVKEIASSNVTPRNNIKTEKEPPFISGTLSWHDELPLQ